MLSLPTTKAIVAAKGGEATELTWEIPKEFDKDTTIKYESGYGQEAILADQITYIATTFGTAVGAQVVGRWLYHKLKNRNGAWLAIA